MRKWLFVILSTIGLVAGVAVGYGGATLAVVARSPFVGYEKGEGFERAFQDMAKLGAYEAVAANCGGSSDVHLATNAQAGVIRDLQKRNGISPSILEVSEAMLDARAMDVAKNNGPMNQTGAGRVQDLLKNAGWTDPSVNHLQEVIRDLDHDQCRLVVLGGGQ